MQSNVAFWIGLGVIFLSVLLILPPTRALLGWLVKSNWLFMPVVHVVHEVVEAHKVVIKNLGPRGLVLPTLDKKRTENKD